MDFRHRVRTTTLQSVLPMKIIIMEAPKRDIHGPLEKGRGSRSAEQIGSMEEGGGRQENEKGRGRGMPRA